MNLIGVSFLINSEIRLNKVRLSFFLDIWKDDLSFKTFLDFIFESFDEECELSVVILMGIVLLIDEHVLFQYVEDFLGFDFIVFPTNFHRHVQLFLFAVHDILFKESILHQSMFLHRPLSFKTIK